MCTPIRYIAPILGVAAPVQGEGKIGLDCMYYLEWKFYFLQEIYWNNIWCHFATGLIMSKACVVEKCQQFNNAILIWCLWAAPGVSDETLISKLMTKLLGVIDYGWIPSTLKRVDNKQASHRDWCANANVTLFSGCFDVLNTCTVALLHCWLLANKYEISQIGVRMMDLKHLRNSSISRFLCLLI